MKKKIIAIALTASLFVTACSTSPDNSAPDTQATTTAAPTTEATTTTTEETTEATEATTTARPIPSDVEISSSEYLVDYPFSKVLSTKDQITDEYFAREGMYYETVDYRVDDFRYTVYIKDIPGYELADDGMDFDLDTRDPISVEECFERYGTLTLQDSETIGNYSSNACFITIFIIDKSKDEIFEHYNNKIDFFEFGFDTQNKKGLGVFGTIGYISETSSSFTVYSCLDENSVIVYGFDFYGNPNVTYEDVIDYVDFIATDANTTVTIVD